MSTQSASPTNSVKVRGTTVSAQLLVVQPSTSNQRITTELRRCRSGSARWTEPEKPRAGYTRSLAGTALQATAEPKPGVPRPSPEPGERPRAPTREHTGLPEPPIFVTLSEAMSLLLVGMRVGDCARQSLIANPLFLSIRVWQTEMLLLLLVQETKKI